MKLTLLLVTATATTGSVATSVSASAIQSASSPVVISDGDFNPANWQETVVHSTFSSSYSAALVGSGGNPGPYRFVTHTLPEPPPNEATYIEVFHKYISDVYVPSVSGPIDSLSYGEDQININIPFPGSEIAVFVSLYQSGKIFVNLNGLAFSNTSWGTQTRSGLTESDFDEYLIGTPLDVDTLSHPDFSIDGDTIFFGCLRANSTCNGCPGYVTTHGYDNWQVSIFRQQGYNSLWHGSSHIMPDSICPTWISVNSADSEFAQLEGDTLLLNTSEYLENMTYIMWEPYISAPETLKIEFAVRFVNGHVEPGQPTRRGHLVSSVTLPFTGFVFWIGQDEVYLWSGLETMGPIASVDTDSDFHVYRIEAYPGGSVAVFYDNILTLNGTVFSYLDHGPLRNIVWGEGTGHFYGQSKWLYFRHNAYAFDTDFDSDGFLDSCDNCPTSAILNQSDGDNDSVGDVCDNCPSIPNPSQSDCDFDGIGDACDYISGDADNNGIITISDAVFLINYIFSGGPAPCPLRNGDADCNGIITISDAVYLINYIFSGGPAPC